MRGNVVGQLHELLYRELFRTQWSKGVLGRYEAFERTAKHLASLLETLLDDACEQGNIASRVGNSVACHAYDGRMYLWWGIEDSRGYGKQVFHIVP